MKLTIKTLVLSTTTFGLMWGVAQNAQAAIVPNVTASLTGLTTDPGAPWNLQNTVNGQGLPGNVPSLTGLHTPSNFVPTAWRSDTLSDPAGTTISGANITFNLNGTYKIYGGTFWNFGGNLQAEAQQGIKDVAFEYSSDGGTNWQALSGAPTQFAQGAYSNDPLNLSFQSPQSFSFNPVTATHVRFTNLSNWGSPINQIGFNEVQFSAASIPEPSSLLALLVFGLAGVSLGKRI